MCICEFENLKGNGCFLASNASSVNLEKRQESYMLFKFEDKLRYTISLTFVSRKKKIFQRISRIKASLYSTFALKKPSVYI